MQRCEIRIFPMVVVPTQSVSVPLGAQLLGIHWDGFGYRLETLVDPTIDALEEVTVQAYTDGATFDVPEGKRLEFVNTVTLGSGQRVHLFAER